MLGGKQVYRVDEQGDKTLVYETDQNGHTTIHDTEDSMAKRHVAAQEKAGRFGRKKQSDSKPSALVPNGSYRTRFM